MRALVVLLLAAPASFAQILGDESGRMGGEAGFFRPTSAPAVRIDAQPFTRTVTCTGSRTLTGTATGAGAVTWSASPDGASGACTGTTSWSCPVAVSPNAAGEGVETITVSQAGGGSATVDIGFYVSGAHSCFLAQSINGTYNSGLSNLDAVATWVNLGSSALNVTQATGSAQPTYRTSIVGGQPVVRCDGGDFVAAATAADWTFLHNGTNSTVDAVWQQTVAAGGVYAGWGTLIINAGSRNGVSQAVNDSTINEGVRTYLGPAGLVFFDSVADAMPDGVLVQTTHTIYPSGDAFADQFSGTNSRFAGASARTFSALAPDSPLTICAANNTGASNFPITGDVWRLLAYQSPLSAIQREINLSVDRWALGTSMPSRQLTTPDKWVFVGDSLTAGSGGVTTWPAKLASSAPTKTFSNVAVGGATSTQIAAQFRANIDGERLFVLGGINDIAIGTAASVAWTALGRVLFEAGLYGSRVVAMPTLPFGNAASWSAPDQVQLELLEASIIASPDYDVLVNWYDLMGQGGTPEDLAAIYDNGDGVHPNEAGTTFMAATMATALGL